MGVASQEKESVELNREHICLYVYILFDSFLVLLKKLLDSATIVCRAPSKLKKRGLGQF